MGKVYKSLKEVVKLQRRKNDAVTMTALKHTHASSLNEEINELVQRIKAPVKHCEEEIEKETQQVIQTLSEDFTMLKTKLKDAEETVRREESARQKAEESLTAKIHDLQNELNTEKETLKSRDNEINDLKSNVDVLVKQVAELGIAIKQAKAEAATEANRVEQLTKSSNTKIAASEAQIRDLKEIVRGKESTIKGLEQNLTAKSQHFENELKNKEKFLAGRDVEINDLKSQLKLLTKLAPDAAQEIVSPELFQRITDELTEAMNVMGRIASIIVRDHVVALGESVKTFPKSRLPELLDSLSKEIANEPLRIGFRKRFVKHV
jgi:chromosome segregation ATPase